MSAPQPAPASSANHSWMVNPLINPNLSSSLSLEYGAIVHDVRRAHDLCAEFQRQLAGKSTELDEYKQLFEKTQSDLFQLQGSIVEMRAERHRLANEAMRAAALRRKVVEITAERDRLLTALAHSKENGPASDAPAGNGRNGMEVEVVLSEMRQAVERLQSILDPDGGSGEKPEAG